MAKVARSTTWRGHGWAVGESGGRHRARTGSSRRSVAKRERTRTPMSAESDSYPTPPTDGEGFVVDERGKRHKVSHSGDVFRPGTRSYYEQMRTRGQADVREAEEGLARLNAQED